MTYTNWEDYLNRTVRVVSEYVHSDDPSEWNGREVTLTSYHSASTYPFTVKDEATGEFEAVHQIEPVGTGYKLGDKILVAGFTGYRIFVADDPDNNRIYHGEPDGANAALTARADTVSPYTGREAVREYLKKVLTDPQLYSVDSVLVSVIGLLEEYK